MENRNIGGRPKKGSEKRERVVVFVRPYHIQVMKDYIKMLNELPEGEMPQNNIEPEDPKFMGVIRREGKTIEDGIVEIVQEPVKPKSSEEPEIDYTQWQSDALMRELDRAVCYETDGYGYPEGAEAIARNNKMLWARAHQAKAFGKTDEYNMIMTELWEKVK